MITYVLECMVFQLLFIIGYDLLLRTETFFQWNRLYLIATFLLSVCLPWARIEALRTSIPVPFQKSAAFIYGLEGVTLSASESAGGSISVSWGFVLFMTGLLFAAYWFAFKIFKLYRLRQRGQLRQFPDFMRVIVANSSMAFSFFRSIYLGDKIPEEEQAQIIRHEMVHIRQKHSRDLLYFELMRIVFWFNPLVYIYQSRIAELHEFIADAQVPKHQRKEQFQLLLSRAFETTGISFINQFFSSSLIKKRIVMLKKSRSRNVRKLKYFLMLPLLVIMLWYSSCKEEAVTVPQESMKVADIENLSPAEEQQLFNQLSHLSENREDWSFVVTDGRSSIKFINAKDESYISGPNNEIIRARMILEGDLSDNFSSEIFGTTKPVPFKMVEKVPVFPGCEDAEDKRACFQEKLMRHVQKNFKYPEEAIAKNISGNVNVLFTIDEYGKVTDIHKRGPHELLEMEVERIISSLPQMQPGRHQGKTVKVPFSMPISFKLD